MSLKHQREIDIFIEGTLNFFDHLSDESNKPIVDTPYLIKNNELVGYDYSGIISVGGDLRGLVLFSAPSHMVKYILLSQNEANHTDTYMFDQVGEVANTIAGNARKHLGPGFHISPPKVFSGAIDVKRLSTESLRYYVLPIRWRNKSAQLIIGFDN